MKESFEQVPYNHSKLPVYVGEGIVAEDKINFYISNWHNDIELVCVKKGNIKYSVNGETINLKEGDFLFINSNQIHYNFSDDMEYCEFICVIFNPLSILNNKEMTEKFVLPVLTNSKMPYLVLNDKSVSDSMEELYEKKTDENFELFLHSLFYRIWSKLISGQSDKKINVNKREMTSFKKMMLFIQNNYKSKITLKQIANSGNVCQTSCNTLFNRYTGLTPIEYLNDYRLRQSILLMNTDMNLTQICFEVGFSGASYYSEQFKKVYGETPKKYREHC